MSQKRKSRKLSTKPRALRFDELPPPPPPEDLSAKSPKDEVPPPPSPALFEDEVPPPPPEEVLTPTESDPLVTSEEQSESFTLPKLDEVTEKNEEDDDLKQDDPREENPRKEGEKKEGEKKEGEKKEEHPKPEGGSDLKADGLRNEDKKTKQEKTLSFKEQMRHQFPVLNDQVIAGLGSLKRAANFLKRLAVVHEKFSQEMIKASELDEESKGDSTGTSGRTDEMADHHESLHSLQRVAIDWAKREKLFYLKIHDHIVPALLNHIRVADTKRLAIVREEQRLTGDMAGYSKELERVRMECLKAWNELLLVKKQLDKKRSKLKDKDKKEKEPKDTKEKDKEKDKDIKDKDIKDKDKEKLLQKPKEKVRLQFQKFEDLQQDTEKKFDYYRFTALPALLESLEQLERERLILIKQQLTSYSEAHKNFFAPLRSFVDLDTNVSKLSADKDLTQCIEHWQEKYGVPPAQASILEPLPCRAADLVSDAWEQSPAAMVASEVSGITLTVMTPMVTRGTVGGEFVRSSTSLSLPSSPSTPSVLTPSLSFSRKLSTQTDTEDDEDDPDGGGQIQAFRADKKELDPWVYCVQNYTPKSGEKDHLTLKEEDVIRIINRDHPEWWVGELVGEMEKPRGKFPRSCVTAIEIGQKAFVNSEEKVRGSVVTMLRTAVSKKKRRFQRDGFNLDLTYITPKIIAMGFPSESLSGIYRNHIKDVQKFLATRHPGAYKVYNLCSEREYSTDKFEGRWARYGFDDHNPCPFNVIEPFCKDVDDFFQSGGDLAAIHCKAGKGRTGFLIACYLQYCGLFDNASEALRYYAYKRTTNARGVTIPSQLRYCYYMEKWLTLRKEKKTIGDRNPVLLTALRIHSPPHLKNPWFTIWSKDCTYTSKGKLEAQRRPAEDYIFFAGTGITGIAALDHDVQIVFYNENYKGKEKLFQLWFNTRFMTDEDIVKDEENEDDDEDRMIRLSFQKWQLDKACKDTQNKHLSDSFRLELIFKSA